MLTLSTQNFSKVEMVVPVRFCYRNQFTAAAFATQNAEWWSQIGNAASKGRLDFEAQNRRVIFRQVARKLISRPNKELLAQRMNAAIWANAPDPDRYQLVFPDTNAPLMDRLTMLQWLRHQFLATGMQFDPIANDGHKVLGFHIAVEGEELITWDGRELSSMRIRLQPKTTGTEDASPTWLWLSQDGRRLPLLFRSNRAFGAFEVRLVSISTRTAPECTIPDATTHLEIP